MCQYDKENPIKMTTKIDKISFALHLSEKSFSFSGIEKELSTIMKALLHGPLQATSHRYEKCYISRKGPR